MRLLLQVMYFGSKGNTLTALMTAAIDCVPGFGTINCHEHACRFASAVVMVHDCVGPSL